MRPPQAQPANFPTTCVACESARSRPLYVVHGFSVVACSGCGLARTMLPPGFDPESTYTEGYFAGGKADGYADYQASRDTLRSEFRRTLDVLACHGVASGSLIEIGCAYGFLLDEAKQRYSVCGVEVCEHAREACSLRGLTVARETTDDFVSRLGPFDAAVMLDVIEHLADPAQVLATLRRAMRPGGVLLLTTGDFGSLLARIAGRRWRLMTPPQHLWFFSAPTLGALLARCGFRVRSVDRPWKIAPLSLVAYQGLRMIGVPAPRWVHAIPGAVSLNLFDTLRVVAEPAPG